MLAFGSGRSPALLFDVQQQIKQVTWFKACFELRRGVEELALILRANRGGFVNRAELKRLDAGMLPERTGRGEQMSLPVTEVGTQRDVSGGHRVMLEAFQRLR
jgi:hypothetical protein